MLGTAKRVPRWERLSRLKHERVSFDRIWFQLALIVCAATPLRADIVVLLEEPSGTFGFFNPTGHAAVYLTNVCAASPTELRRCGPGEPGVVISRYQSLAGRDWIAVPVVAFFYGVDRIEDFSLAPDRASVQAIRDTWRRSHLASIAPDTPDGKAPPGDWNELIGVAYDRATLGFQLATTAAQDDRLIRELNARPNRKRFHILFRNCADFVREIVNRYYPKVVKRSILADGGITTPKQVVKCFVRYGRRNSELSLSSFAVPQLPGFRRSKATRGLLESFVRSKKYVAPLAFFQPWVAGGMGAAYLTRGRFNPAREAAALNQKQPEWAPLPTVSAGVGGSAQPVRTRATGN